MILEPLPRILRIGQDEAHFMIECPRLINGGVPLPEPLPKVRIFCSAREPAQVQVDIVLLVLFGHKVTYAVSDEVSKSVLTCVE